MFLSTEFLSSCVIGYTKQKPSNLKYHDKVIITEMPNINNEINGNQFYEDFNNLNEPFLPIVNKN